MEKNKKKAFEGMGIDERGNFGRLDQNGKNFTTNETKFDQFINNKLDLQDPWSPNDWSALKKTAEEKPTEFFTESQRLAKGRQ